MNNVVFDIGDVVVRWSPFLALDHILAHEAGMERAFTETGYCDWNLELDRGRNWADGITVAERQAPARAHAYRAYADGLGPAHRERAAGTSDLIEALHARGVGLFALNNPSLAFFEAAKAAAPALGLNAGRARVRGWGRRQSRSPVFRPLPDAQRCRSVGHPLRGRQRTQPRRGRRGRDRGAPLHDVGKLENRNSVPFACRDCEGRGVRTARRSFRNVKKWQACFLPLSSQFAASKIETFS